MSEHRKTFLLTVITAAAIHAIVTLAYRASETTNVAPLGTELNTIAALGNWSSATKVVRPKLDLAFCIDTTGSMQGEIDTVKAKVKSMVAKLTSGQPKPIVRIGLVAYRDKGDLYKTKVFPFTQNVDSFLEEISGLNADGGGDHPEAVDCGLHSAMNELDWGDEKTSKLLFLIGDAPPHSDKFDYDWATESKEAADRNIRINTIGCDGSAFGTDLTVAFKEIASLTNGTFEPLAYHQEITDASGNKETLITSEGKTFVVKSTVGEEGWKEGAASLITKGMAVSVPYALQGATNGTIGPQGGDTTSIMGVNTAGTVVNREDSNLDSVMLKGAQDLMGGSN